MSPDGESVQRRICNEGRLVVGLYSGQRTTALGDDDGGVEILRDTVDTTVVLDKVQTRRSIDLIFEVLPSMGTRGSWSSTDLLSSTGP